MKKGREFKDHSSYLNLAQPEQKLVSLFKMGLSQRREIRLASANAIPLKMTYFYTMKGHRSVESVRP